MPITTIPDGLDEEMVAKRKTVRRKVLSNMQDKYLFDVLECTQPTDIVVEDEKLVGLKVISNEVVDGKLIAIKDSEKIINADLFISSIGSLPEPIKGVPMNGSTYDIIDQESGKFNDFDTPFRGVFIRAPLVERIGDKVEVLASVEGHPVFCREGKIMVTSFHPELVGDDRVHRLFLETAFASN